jgi:hypothetical protein
MTWINRLWCWVWRHAWGEWEQLEYTPDSFDMVLSCSRCGRRVEKHFHRTQEGRGA